MDRNNHLCITNYCNLIFLTFNAEIVIETIEWVETEIVVTEIEILDVAEAAIERETIDEAVTEIVAIGMVAQYSNSNVLLIFNEVHWQ